jgi:hypothetical protein
MVADQQREGEQAACERHPVDIDALDAAYRGTSAVRKEIVV